jgi:hypothetical protein
MNHSGNPSSGSRRTPASRAAARTFWIVNSCASSWVEVWANASWSPKYGSAISRPRVEVTPSTPSWTGNRFVRRNSW